MKRLLHWLALIAVSTPLLIFAFGAFFNRNVLDEFCTLVQIRQIGEWQLAVQYYLQWTGRFTQIANILLLTTQPFLIQCFALIGAYLLAWLALFLLFKRIAHVRNWQHQRFTSALCASLTLLFVISGLVRVTQNLYWVMAVWLYTVPPILIVLMVWLFAKAPETTLIGQYGASVACFLLVFTAVGYTEILAVVMPLALVMLCAYYVVERKRIPTRVRAALAASVLAAVIVIAAPGNFARANTLTETSENSSGFNLDTFIRDTVSSPISIALASTIISPLLLPTIFAASVALGKRQEKQRLQLPLRWIWGAALLLIMASFSLALFATRNPPPDRSWIIPQSVLYSAIAVTGYQVGSRLRNVPERHVSAIAIVLVSFTVGWSMLRAVDTFSLMRDFAEQWDKRDQAVRAALAQPRVYNNDNVPYTWFRDNQDTLRIPFYQSPFGLENIGEDASYWTNVCFSAYYQIPRTVAVP
jgi:hypothetical protein